MDKLHVEAAAPAWLVAPLAVAAAALAAGLASATDPSTVTGAGAGLCLFAFGLATLLIPGRAATSAPEEPAQRSP
jgi:tellurite resistance protein TehA-like permease